MNLRRHAAATTDLFVCLMFGNGYHLTTDLLGTQYIDYRIKYVKTVPMVFFSPKWPTFCVTLSPCFSLLDKLWQRCGEY